MKKVLFSIDTLQGGGAEKVLYDILKNINLSEYNIELFLLENKGIYKEKIKELGINIEFLFNERKDLFNNILYRKFKSMIIRIMKYIYCKYPLLIKKLRSKNFDVEIAFLEGYSTVLIANRKNNSQKIAWIHTDLKKHRVLNTNLEKESYQKINKIICVSEDSKKSVLKLYPENNYKLQVIYNPIDKNNILKKSKEKSNINFDKNKINIIIIGRLTKVKGYDILLQSHNKLIKEGLKYNLIILGEGSERKKMEKYIKENNLENNTQLLGFKENPYPYLKEADVFVSSSRYEGYPLVLCEAVCLGKPIIATNCTGPKEILENSKYGLMAEVENIEDLADKMKKLILNEKLRKKYSDLSKKRAEIFNIKKTMQEIEDLLDEK